MLLFSFYHNINHYEKFEKNIDPIELPEYIKKNWEINGISMPDLKYKYFSEWEFLKDLFGETVLEECPLLVIDRV